MPNNPRLLLAIAAIENAIDQLAIARLGLPVELAEDIDRILLLVEMLHYRATDLGHKKEGAIESTIAPSLQQQTNSIGLNFSNLSDLNDRLNSSL